AGPPASRGRAAPDLAALAPGGPADLAADLEPYREALAVRPSEPAELPGWSPRYVEVEARDPAHLPERLAAACERWPGTVVAARLPLGGGTAESAGRLVEQGVGVLPLHGDETGRDSAGRWLAEAIREVHGALVEAALRDRVTLVVSGGIAAAEHVAKAIACGADLVAVDFILMVAWGTSLWADRGPSPIEA